jgi:hypothetical protein
MSEDTNYTQPSAITQCPNNITDAHNQKGEKRKL